MGVLGVGRDREALRYDMVSTRKGEACPKSTAAGEVTRRFINRVKMVEQVKSGKGMVDIEPARLHCSVSVRSEDEAGRSSGIPVGVGVHGDYGRGTEYTALPADVLAHGLSFKPWMPAGINPSVKLMPGDNAVLIEGFA